MANSVFMGVLPSKYSRQLHVTQSNAFWLKIKPKIRQRAAKHHTTIGLNDCC